MHNILRLCKKRIIWLPAAGIFILIIIGGGLFLDRAFIRNHFLPDFTTGHRIGTLKKTYADEYAKLGKPFAVLGIPLHTTAGPGCYLSDAEWLRTDVNCLITADAHPESISSNVNISQFTQKTTKLLADNGWTTPDVSSGAPILSTITGMYANDSHYIEETYYAKQIGNITCQFLLNTPGPELLGGTYLCWQDFTYL